MPVLRAESGQAECSRDRHRGWSSRVELRQVASNLLGKSDRVGSGLVGWGRVRHAEPAEPVGSRLVW